MATIFRNLFRSKKGNGKKDEDATEDLEREVTSRRSFRAGTSKAAPRRSTTARFADDGMLSATAAYHTNNSQKFRKGPQSCPGGYREESEGSYDSEMFASQKKDRRGRADMSSRSIRHIPIDEEPSRGSSRGHRDHHRSFVQEFRRGGGRGETSEYGSGDPSPIGNFNNRDNRHSHYDERLEESDNEDFDNDKQMMMMENTCRHYLQKWKESEQKRKEDRKKFKEMEKEKEDMQKVLFRQIDQLNKDKERYKTKIRQLENQLNEMNNMRSQQYSMPMSYNPNSFNNFCVPQAPSSGHGHHGQRLSSFMNVPVSTSNTPTTMNTSGCGAGESLAQPSDTSLRLLQLQSMGPLSLNNTMGTSPSFKVPTSSFGDDDDEGDEVKNFRSGVDKLSIETARAVDRRDEIERIEALSSSSHDSSVTLSEDVPSCSSKAQTDKENEMPSVRLRASITSSSASSSSRLYSVLSL